MYRLHARYVQSSLEQLARVNEGNDWELQAQVALWITSGSIIMRLSDITSSYIGRGCDAINAGKLRFIPVYGRPPELSEIVHERSAVLSQIIYFENLLFLTSGGPHPKMTDIETEFRHSLPVCPAVLPYFVAHFQLLAVGDLFAIVQDMSVDHAHARHPAGQRHGGLA